MTEQTKPRFENVSCSQCGRDFGPGEHGFSHCENHPGWKRDRKLKRQAAAKRAAETRKANAAVPFHDVCNETAYGTTQRLSFAIRVF